MNGGRMEFWPVVYAIDFTWSGHDWLLDVRRLGFWITALIIVAFHICERLQITSSRSSRSRTPSPGLRGACNAPELINAERDLKIQSSCMCHGWRKKEFLTGFSCRLWLKKSWLRSGINTSRNLDYSINDSVYKLQPPEAHDYRPKFQTIPLLPYRINLRELRDRQTHITHTPSPGLRGAAKSPELGFHAVAVATPLSTFCCNRHSQFPWTQE